MKTIVCTHTDLDGLGCWFVFDFFKIHYDEILLCDYDRFEDEIEYNKLLNYDKIIMTDFSVTNKIAQKLLDCKKQLIVIDHHEGSEPLKEISHDNFILIHNKEKSGTLLTYEYFKPKNTREKKIFYQFIELVNTYDLFKKKDPLWEDAQNMNRVLYSCLAWGADNINDKYRFIKDYWFNKFNKFNEWEWSKFEKEKIQRAIEKEDKQFNESKMCLKKYVDSKGLKFGVTTAKSKVSIVALRLLEENEDIQYIAIINTYTGEWEKVSLRSRDENVFNCNSFLEAKGHGCAAGGEVDKAFAIDLYKGKKQFTYKD
jgi:oligoribonuclease NrnB/cAMP/cGMP phosphodiesterase (DHH superfamily)